MDEKLHNSKKSELIKFLFQFYSFISRGKLDAARNVNFRVERNEGKVGVPETNLERIVHQLKNATLHLARGKVQKALNEFQQVKDSLRLLTLLLGSHKSPMRIKLGKDDIALLYLEATLGIIEATFRCGKLEMTWQELEEGSSVLATYQQAIPNDIICWLRGRILYWKATVLWKKKYLEKSSSLLTEGLALLEQYSNFPHDHLKAELFKRMGSVFRARGNLDEALNYYQKGLEISEREGHDITTASILNSIGLIYQERGELDQALHFFRRSLELSKKTETNDAQAATLTNIGVTCWMK